MAEFLPPARRARTERVIILCDGMPSIPRKQPLMEFLAAKGYWVFYPRYRGAWESGGEFLERSPHRDILDVVDALPRGFRELAFRRKFKVSPDQVFVIGGSFGGPAAILSSLDPRITRAVANCPVVDWAILPEAEKAETSNRSYVAYIREAFGHAYRLSERNWRKLRNGKFYNPAFYAEQIDPAKIMMFHAKDDPNVPYRSVKDFAERTGIRLNTLESGGHVSTDFVVRKYWKRIEKFFAG